jgi:N-acetylmuramoyl-L-alanine amidase
LRRFLLFFIFFLPVFSLQAQKGGYKTVKPLIYLDPGHGGLDLGAIIKNPRCEEKRFCLTVSHYTKRYLEKMGYWVSFTRSRDFFVSLPRRVSVANKAKAGIFVAIHFNSCSHKSVHGIETYYYDDRSKRAVSSRRLADCVQRRVVFRTKEKSRKVKRGKFYVIRETKMPAILIEAGFLTNPFERKNIRRREYLNEIAKGIAEGIDSFVRGK